MDNKKLLNMMGNSDELGLDDVECFQEFMKFKKSRELLKARESQSQDRKPSKEISVTSSRETGSNPPPPGDESYDPPPYVPSTHEQRNGSEAGDKRKTDDAASTDKSLSIPLEISKPRRGSDDTRDLDSSRQGGRSRGYDRSLDLRSRRRSRSRDREWRRRSPSGSPSRSGRRGERRDSREYRPARDRLRYEPRMSRRRSRSFSPSARHPYQQQFEEISMPNYFPGPAMGIPNMPPGPMHCSDWETAPPGTEQPWKTVSALSQQEEEHARKLAAVEQSRKLALEEQARKIAIEKEAENQRQTFISQRMEYLSKRETYLGELSMLKAQSKELGSSKIPEVAKFQEQNATLQEEITKKIESVDSVLDLLRKLIGDPPKDDPPAHSNSEKERKKKKRKRSSRSRSMSSGSHDARRSRSKKPEESKKSDEEKIEKNSKGASANEEPEQQFNLVFYDPEVHWCRPCKAFPATAKEYLLHLHSNTHKQMTQDQKLSELAWHDMNVHREPVVIEGLEQKRCPIKGLQFFEASTAWFCKLCQSWMGDLHCASLHLKSYEHNKKFGDFVLFNPKWEAQWLSDRGKAVISSGKKEDVLKRQLEEQLLLQRKHEDELRLSLEATAGSGLLMPLTLPKASKEKSKKKSKDKKGKKKKRGRSSDSSSDSSSSSSSSEDEKSPKNKKSKRKSKSKPEIVIPIPEKSKWERGDSEEQEDSSGITVPQRRQPRNYRWTGELENLGRQQRASTPPPPVPEKHSILIPESTKIRDTRTRSPGRLVTRARSPPRAAPTLPSLRMRPKEVSHDDGESRFDKQTQAAAKKKQPPVVLPKSKFAFIGRMPFAKRRTEPNDEKIDKGQDVPTPDPTPPPPPIISNKPVPVPVAPPPVLTTKTKVEVAKTILSQPLPQNIFQRPVDPVMMDEDMEIDTPALSPPRIDPPPSPPKIRPVLPPEVTTNLGKKNIAIPLPKDFQEALSIIYPEPKPVTPPLPPMPPPPSGRVPSPPVIVPPREASPPLPPMPPPPSGVGQSPTVSKMADFPDFDEMELLGIDKEDMAAQYLC